MEYLIIFVTCILTGNVLITQQLGVCPSVGLSNNTKSAFCMGIVVSIVLTFSAFLSYILFNYVLVPLEIEFLNLIVTIVLIGGMVQIVDLLLKNVSPNLYKAFGIYLPLISTNCLILGVALSVISYESLAIAVITGFATGVGYIFAITILSILKKHINQNFIPKCFRGLPITLIILGIMAMAFTAFTGLF